MDPRSVADWEVDSAPQGTHHVVSATCISCSEKKEGGQETYSYPVNKVNGITYPMSCSQERWVHLNETVRYKESDLLIVTYPKCGTTWIEQCVLLLLNDGNQELLNPAHKNVYIPDNPSARVGKIWPEACISQDPIFYEKSGLEFKAITLDEFNDAPNPRIIKSHAPVELILGGVNNIPSSTKVIIVVRNLLDACVSSYYHAFNPFKSGWPFSAWAAVWLSGNFAHGSWFDWIKGWYKFYTLNKSNRNIHWVCFEDLKANPKETVQSLADFLGVGAETELVNRAVVNSTFESMKEQSLLSGGDAKGHLRKGESGDWKNHYNEELRSQFLSKFHSELEGTGISFMLSSDVNERIVAI